MQAFHPCLAATQVSAGGCDVRVAGGKATVHCRSPHSQAALSMDFTCRHFTPVLRQHKCQLEDVMYEWQEAKLQYIAGLHTAKQHSPWKDIMIDEELKSTIPNLLHIVEILLVLPFSTAACERGFDQLHEEG